MLNNTPGVQVGPPTLWSAMRSIEEGDARAAVKDASKTHFTIPEILIHCACDEECFTCVDVDARPACSTTNTALVSESAAPVLVATAAPAPVSPSFAWAVFPSTEEVDHLRAPMPSTTGLREEQPVVANASDVSRQVFALAMPPLRFGTRRPSVAVAPDDVRGQPELAVGEPSRSLGAACGCALVDADEGDSPRDAPPMRMGLAASSSTASSLVDLLLEGIAADSEWESERSLASAESQSDSSEASGSGSGYTSGADTSCSSVGDCGLDLGFRPSEYDDSESADAQEDEDEDVFSDVYDGYFGCGGEKGEICSPRWGPYGADHGLGMTPACMRAAC